MTLQLPTALSIKLKFPEFKRFPDDTIEFAIEEASQSVDDSWIVSSPLLALSYLTAHILMVARQRMESATGQVVASESIGRMSIRYAQVQQPSQAQDSDLTTTPYGTRYLYMLKQNKPAILIV